jgi:hypothetical protein
MRTQFPWDHPLLLWWAECLDLVDQLTPRNRARALSLTAEDLRKTLATMPDREYVPPWLINELLEWEVFELLPREWHVSESEEQVRIVG